MTFQQTRFGAGCCLLLWAATTCLLMVFVGIPLLFCMQAGLWFEKSKVSHPEINP